MYPSAMTSLKEQDMNIENKEEPDDLAKQLAKLHVGDAGKENRPEVKTEVSETEQLKKLANLLNRPVRDLARMWSVAKQTGYCLRCSRCYLMDFLSLKELQKYDSLWHPDYECRCEM